MPGNIVPSSEIMRTGLKSLGLFHCSINCSSILNVTIHLQRAYVYKRISDDIFLRADPEEFSQGTYPEGRISQFQAFQFQAFQT